MATTIDKVQVDVSVNGLNTIDQATASLGRLDSGVTRLVDAFDGIRYKARIVGANFQDMAVQLELGTNPLRVMGQQIPEIMAAFGAFGAVLGGITAVAIPTTVLILKGMGVELRNIHDMAKDASDSVRSFAENQRLAQQSSLDLKLKYGELAEAARQYYKDQAEFDKIVTFKNLGASVEELKSRLSSFSDVSEKAFRGARGDMGGFSGDILDIGKRIAAWRLDITAAQAEEVNKRLQAINQNKPEEVAKVWLEIVGYIKGSNSEQSLWIAQQKGLIGDAEKLAKAYLQVVENQNAAIEKTSIFATENLKLQSSFIPQVNQFKRDFDTISAIRKEGQLKIAEYELNLNRNTNLDAKLKADELSAFKKRTQQDVSDKEKDFLKTQQEAFYAQMLSNEGKQRQLDLQKNINQLQIGQVNSLSYQSILEESTLKNISDQQTALLGIEELRRKNIITEERARVLREQAGEIRAASDKIALQNVEKIRLENERSIRIQIEGLVIGNNERLRALNLDEKIFLMGTNRQNAERKILELENTRERTIRDTNNNNKLSDSEKLSATQKINEEYDRGLVIIQKELEYRQKMDANMKLGAQDRLRQINESFTPFKIGGMMIDSVFSNMNSAIDRFVETGKFKFSDFATSVVQDLLKIQMKAAATSLLSQGLGFLGITLPGKASGGPVSGNQAYMVGEQGPELFIPSSAGNIVPNYSLRGQGAGTTIINNISAIDAKSVAQLFAENRMTLFGTVEQARRELPMRTR